MPIIVEDGSIVLGANSYNSLAEVRAYAALRGFTLPVADSALEPFVIRATDYLETFKYKGFRVSPIQSLSFPRTGVPIPETNPCSGETYPSNIVPTPIKNAQIEIVVGMVAGINPMANDDGSAQIIEEQVDVLRVKYASPVAGDSSKRPVITAAMALLEDFLTSGGAGASVLFTRV